MHQTRNSNEILGWPIIIGVYYIRAMSPPVFVRSFYVLLYVILTLAFYIKRSTESLYIFYKFSVVNINKIVFYVHTIPWKGYIWRYYTQLFEDMYIFIQSTCILYTYKGCTKNAIYRREFMPNKCVWSILIDRLSILLVKLV